MTAWLIYNANSYRFLGRRAGVIGTFQNRFGRSCLLGGSPESHVGLRLCRYHMCNGKSFAPLEDMPFYDPCPATGGATAVIYTM